MQSESRLQMESRLRSLYRDLLERVGKLPPPLVEKLGCPFLPFPNEGWSECKQRLLLVGQEPFEWTFEKGEGGPPMSWPHDRLTTLREVLDLGADRSVEALTSGYLASCAGPTARGPFNQAFDLFKRSLDREGAASMVSTNLVRCAFKGKRKSLLNASEEERRQVLDWQRGCLTGELKALNPTAVVFLTGPYYDEFLGDEFPSVEYERFGDHDKRQLARVRLGGLLPEASFRTYHPGFLRRSKTRWSWLEELAREVTRGIRAAG